MLETIFCLMLLFTVVYFMGACGYEIARAIRLRWEDHRADIYVEPRRARMKRRSPLTH